jgi:branched-chain amino acid transport system substrate-binding protein
MRWLPRLAVAVTTLLLPLVTGCSGDIKIGAVVSESGAVDYAGIPVRKGMDLALEQINDDGGFKGKPLEIIYKDDATNSSRGVQVTEELINQEGVRIVIGAVSSEVSLAIAPICEKNRVLMLSPSASAAALTEAGDYIYRIYPSDIVEGTAMAKFAKDLGLERVAVFTQNNEFGAGLRDIFTQQYEGRFRKVVKTVDFEEGSVTGMADQIAEVAELNPDGIYIVSYIADMASLLSQIRAAGIDTVILGSGSITEELVRLAGDAADNVVYPQPNFDPASSDPEVARFVAAYRAKYGEDDDPNIYAAHGYDAVKLIRAAMEQSGSSHPDDVRRGFRGIEEFTGAAGRTQFDSNGDVVRYPRIFIIRDGVAKPYEQFVDEGGSLFEGS